MAQHHPIHRLRTPHPGVVLLVSSLLTGGISHASATSATSRTESAAPATGLVDEVWDDVPCPLGCSSSTGNLIAVSAAETKSGIDFTVELTTPGGIAGTVRDASTGGPLAELSFVDVFDALGSYIDSAEVTGAFAIGDLLPGTYFLSTDTSDNVVTYIDELYQDLSCHPGGALNFACDPLKGTPVVVSEGSLTTGIVIELERELLFADGFESGDLSAWIP